MLLYHGDNTTSEFDVDKHVDSTYCTADKLFSGMLFDNSDLLYNTAIDRVFRLDNHEELANKIRQEIHRRVLLRLEKTFK